MEEQLISFKTAKLAKQKGFPQFLCTTHYDSSKKLIVDTEGYPNGDRWIKYMEKCISAPTQSLLQKWLRDIHNIHIIIEPIFDEKNNIDYFGWRAKNKGSSSKLGGIGDTYENALEEALKTCLNTL